MCCRGSSRLRRSRMFLLLRFFASTGMNRPDPTGLIACPQPCNVNYAAAYSLYEQNSSRSAASWEFAGNNFDVLMQYEFENHILEQLGYAMRWRRGRRLLAVGRRKFRGRVVGTSGIRALPVSFRVKSRGPRAATRTPARRWDLSVRL